MIEGGLTKHVRAEGDEAAVQLTKVLTERDVKDTEIDISLIVLSDAFSDLKLVEVISDRHPRTAAAGRMVERPRNLDGLARRQCTVQNNSGGTERITKGPGRRNS